MKSLLYSETPFDSETGWHGDTTLACLVWHMGETGHLEFTNQPPGRHSPPATCNQGVSCTYSFILVHQMRWDHSTWFNDMFEYSLARKKTAQLWRCCKLADKRVDRYADVSDHESFNVSACKYWRHSKVLLSSKATKSDSISFVNCHARSLKLCKLMKWRRIELSLTPNQSHLWEWMLPDLPRNIITTNSLPTSHLRGAQLSSPSNPIQRSGAGTCGEVEFNQLILHTKRLNQNADLVFMNLVMGTCFICVFFLYACFQFSV